jgi:hypothetical protein
MEVLPMVRTTVFLPKAIVAGLAEAAKNDPAALKSSQLIRMFISAGLAARKRQQAK